MTNYQAWYRLDDGATIKQSVFMLTAYPSPHTRPVRQIFSLTMEWKHFISQYFCEM